MEIRVTQFFNLDRALTQMKKEVSLSGIRKDLSLHAVAKPSERKKLKRRMAERRRAQSEKKRLRYLREK